MRIADGLSTPHCYRESIYSIKKVIKRTEVKNYNTYKRRYYTLSQLRWEAVKTWV